MRGSFRLGADGIYRCDAFQDFVWQKHGFGTRQGNPEVDLTLKQVHSDRVLVADGLKDGAAEGDALITDQIGKAIGVKTADCVPILLLDPETRAVAAVHAGWRGSAAEVVSRAIEKMQEAFGTQPSGLYAALGPCIRACCYEVGVEVFGRFEGVFPEWGRVSEGGMLDLPEVNTRQLKAAGVPADNIFDSGLCTACQSGSFFSYRREPENPGRMVAAICRLS